jgi:hypothetical protein
MIHGRIVPWRPPPRFVLLSAVVLIGLTGQLISATARADTVLAGMSDDGAFYKIVVPDAWNGDLVIWNQGLFLEPREPVSDLGPLALLQLSEGYAVAASSYQQIGWSLFKTKNDLQYVVGVFKDNFGQPEQIFLNGASMGGLVTAQAIEEASLGNVVGAFPFCGPLAGSRNWDGGVDLRLAYDAVCGEVAGAAIPGGAAGLPAPGFPGVAFSPAELAFAVHACTGVLAPPEARSPLQVARLATILDVTTIPNEDFLLRDMGYVTFAMSNLVHQKLDGHVGAGNIGVVYSDAAVDAEIERVAPHPGAANRLATSYTPHGSVGDTKIVSMHTDKDGLVFVENEKEYQDVVPAQNLTTAVVVESAPSHCVFTPPELIAGWESLRAWVASGSQPSATDIQSLCVSLGAGACRIDSSFVLEDLDTRIAPR